MTDLMTMPENYDNIRSGIVELLKAARSAAARNVNSIITATYWEIGRRIVHSEKAGEKRAEYGATLIPRLSDDLSAVFGKGFGARNLAQMRSFFLAWPEENILQTPSAKYSNALQNNELPTGHLSALSLPLVFPCPGQLMSDCFPSRIQKPGSSTNLKPFALAGPSASSTVRSAASSTSVLPFPRTKPPCWRRRKLLNHPMR